MKFISAALVIFSGVFALIVSITIDHSDSALFLGFVGSVTALIGIGGWVSFVRNDVTSNRANSND